MNINKYTEKAQEAVLGAQKLADAEGHPEITPEHLLFTLLEQRDGIVPEIVRKMNADPAVLAAAVKGELDKDPERKGYGVLVRIDKIRGYSGFNVVQER